MKETDLVVWLRMNSFLLREGELKTVLPYRGGGKNPAYCGVFLFPQSNQKKMAPRNSESHAVHQSQLQNLRSKARAEQVDL